MLSDWIVGKNTNTSHIDLKPIYLSLLQLALNIKLMLYLGMGKFFNFLWKDFIGTKTQETLSQFSKPIL